MNNHFVILLSFSYKRRTSKVTGVFADAAAAAAAAAVARRQHQSQKQQQKESIIRTSLPPSVGLSVAAVAAAQHMNVVVAVVAT